MKQGSRWRTHQIEGSTMLEHCFFCPWQENMYPKDDPSYVCIDMDPFPPDYESG